MGITIDASDRALIRKKSSSFEYDKKAAKLKSLKYAVLIISLLTALAGVHISGVVDPLSMAYRSYAVTLYAYFDRLIRIIFEGLYYVPLVNVISEPVFDFFKDHFLDFNRVTYYEHVPVFFVFLTVLLLSIINKRFWCKSLCPLGAVFAISSKFSIFRRIVDPKKCNSCKKCQISCRMSAIFDNGQKTLEEECIKCFECLKVCPSQAAAFKFTAPDFIKNKILKPEITVQKTENQHTKITRKTILQGFLASLFFIPFLKVNANKKIGSFYIIRPPGSRDEEDFLQKCIRCAQCMKVCPTNALHPAFLETGIEGMFAPRLIPRLGYCEKNCNLCSKICPTDALEKYEKTDKEKYIIGTAYFDKDRCIPWAESINCIVCEEMCPTSDKAIKFRNEISFNKKNEKVKVMLPYVIEELCIGCGICENKCPVPGDGAIRVTTPKSAEGINRF